MGGDRYVADAALKAITDNSEKIQASYAFHVAVLKEYDKICSDPANENMDIRRRVSEAFRAATESGFASVRVFVEGKDDLRSWQLRGASPDVSIEGQVVEGKYPVRMGVHAQQGLKAYYFQAVSKGHVFRDSGRIVAVFNEIPAENIVKIVHGRTVLYERAAG